jgi:hypothetical protein
MSWYVEGNDARRDEFIKNAYHSKALTFWMKKGETKELIFMDDPRFGIYEHKISTNGKWKPFTCSTPKCSFCGVEKDRSYTEYSSILDLTPYKAKDGKEVKYSRKLLAAGRDVAAILADRRNDCGGTLVGARFKVSRTGEKSYACGNDWKFVGKVDLSKLPPDVKAYDYRDVLKPRPIEEQDSILSWAMKFNQSADTVSRNDLQSGEPAYLNQAPPVDDDSIPF